MIFCTHCGAEFLIGAQFCAKCGTSQSGIARPPAAAAPLAPGAALAFDCPTCRTPGGLEKDSVPRCSSIVRLIGVILVLPSIIGMLISGMAIFGVGTESSALGADAQAGAGIVGGMLIVVFFFSLVSGLVGWLLLMNRKVFKCTRCGFILDRA